METNKTFEEIYEKSTRNLRQKHLELTISLKLFLNSAKHSFLSKVMGIIMFYTLQSKKLEILLPLIYRNIFILTYELISKHIV